MAYIRKRGDSWQAVVRIKGHAPVSATRPTKREAELWAKAEEAAIYSGLRGQYPTRTLAEALERYERDVSATKRSGGNESKRFAALRRDYPDLCAKILHTIGPDDLAGWRDARLRTVTRGTVQREINILRHVWSVAGTEWGWCDPAVWKRVRKPGHNPPRTATWGWREIRAMLRRLDYHTGWAPVSAREEVAYLFLLSLQTAMRQGELQGLTVDRIDLQRRTIRLDTHKTVERVGTRIVPIPRRALKVLRVLADNAGPDGRLVRVGLASVSALFLKYRDQIGLGHLTFHDARATAATLLCRRVDPVTLARVMGHRDLKQLIDTYYREAPESIAGRM